MSAVEFPQASGLNERVRHPDVGVGGGVGVQDLPLAVLVLAPEPGRKMGVEIAAGQIGLGPGEDAVEGGAIVVGQRKEEGVGLAFRGGVLISVGIEDAAALRVDEARRVGVPELPGTLLAAARQENMDKATISNRRFKNRFLGIASVLG